MIVEVSDIDDAKTIDEESGWISQSFRCTSSSIATSDLVRAKAQIDENSTEKQSYQLTDIGIVRGPKCHTMIPKVGEIDIRR